MEEIEPSFAAEHDQQHKKLDDLPSEILSVIYDVLIDVREVDISVSNRSTPIRPQLRYRYSDPFKALRPLLTTNKVLREVTEDWINRNVQFRADSAFFEHVPAAFGPRNCFLVRRLALELSENTPILAERSWPSLLATLVTYLPNLKDLVVWTCKDSGMTIEHPWRQRPNRSVWAVVSDDDRRVAVWKFASFLALRHPGFVRVCSKKDSEINQVVSRVVVNDGASRKTLRTRSSPDPPSTQLANQYEDAAGQPTEAALGSAHLVLDAALIRRTKWEFVSTSPIERFLQHEDSQTSQQDSLSNHAQEIYTKYVDDRSYQTSRHHIDRDWAKRTNDELIDPCEKYLSRLNISTEQHLQHFLEDDELCTKVKLNLEKQLQEARDELTTVKEDMVSLQRRYDWAIEDRRLAASALREQINRMHGVGTIQHYNGLVRGDAENWCRDARTRRW